MVNIVNNPFPAKSTWPKHMLIAEKEVGTRETPGGLTDNPRIIEYQKATRIDEQALGDETAWCASWVSWVLQNSGMKNPRYALARNFLKYGTPVEVPEFGDILVFSRGTGLQGHVAFFVLDLGADFEILSGNTRNSVCYSHYPKDHLLGIRRPVEK